MSAEPNESDDSVNISKLRQMGLQGKEYREEHDFDYIGDVLTLFIKPIIGLDFLPIAAYLEDKLDIDADEAQEKLSEEKESGESGSIDPSSFDREFVEVMSEVAVMGIDTTQGDAEGEDEEGLKEIFAISENDEENIGLIGGASLEIAEKVLDISSNAEDAEKFRRNRSS